MTEIENKEELKQEVKEKIEIPVSPKKNCKHCNEYGNLKIKYATIPKGMFGSGKINCPGGITIIQNCQCVNNKFIRTIKEMGIKTETRKEKPEHDYEKNFYYKDGKEVELTLKLVNNRIRPEPVKEEIKGEK